MMTHTFFTGTYSVKSDCSKIGVPFTRSKKAEAEKIFISTFFIFVRLYRISISKLFSRFRIQFDFLFLVDNP